MKKTIGIDLGTGFSCVAVMENGNATVIQNSEGGRTTPSIVGFTKQGDRVVGLAAKNQAVTNSQNTIYAVKRAMGKKFSDLKDDIAKWPFKVVDNGNDVRIEVTEDGQQKKFSPQEISAFILQKMKKTAEDYLGEEVTDAVITCPAYYNDTQRQAVKDAGKIAGLNVLRIINEPTAAALAYGIKDSDSDKTIAVFDSGSGTFDVTILEVGGGVFEVLATNGNTHLGGTDFDNCIIDWLLKDFKEKNGIDLSGDSMAMQRLKDESEKAKISLSTQTQTEINIPFITADANGPKHLQQSLTRAKFEELCDSLFEAHREPCMKALSDAGKSPSDIDEVILVGGSTRIPKIQQIVKEIFGKEGNKGVNPDEAVACGAAIQGGVLAGDVKDVLLLDVTPLSLGIETMGSVFTKIIDRNTTIPTEKSQIFSTAADGQPAVTIRVAQGERTSFNDNKLLGQFNLDGIPPAPRGVPQIEVTFKLDANGILTVKATDKGSGKEQHITVQNDGGLSKDEIERMVKDAEAHADDDKKLRESVDVKNEAESFVYNTEKQLKEFADKISPENKSLAEDAVANLKKSLEGGDTAEIKKKLDEAKQASYKIGETLYQAQQQTAEHSSGNADDVSYEVHD